MGITPFHGPPADPPAVPGFAASTLLGLGAHGAVWLAREQITGDVVALKIGRGADVTAGSGLREAELLARLDHPHLIRLRRVVPMEGGALALVLDLAGGGSLAALIAARGRLSAGEVVTLLVPLAEVLDHLHDQDLVHGDVAPGNVLFSADGRPKLGDLGVSGVLSMRPLREWSTPGFTDPALAHGGDDRSADVWSLGAVGWFALTGQPPGIGESPRSPRLVDDSDDLDDPVPAALFDVLRDCLALDPQLRPSLAEVAVRAWDAAPAVPISLLVPSATVDDAEFGAWPDPDPALRLTTAPASRVPAGSSGAPGGSWRPTRRHLGAALIGGLLAAAAALVLLLAPGITWGDPVAPVSAEPSTGGSVATSAGGGEAPSAGGQTQTSAQGGTTPSTGGDPETPAGEVASPEVLVTALHQIARARAAAFSQVSLTYLAGADEPGSPAEKLDADFVRSLAAAGVRLDGIAYTIRQIRPVASSRDEVVVTVLVTTSAHRQIGTDAGGRVIIRQVPATAPLPVRLRLIRQVGQDHQVGQDGQDSAEPGTSAWRVRMVEPVPGGGQ